MRIEKITFHGQKQNPPAFFESSDDIIEIQESYVVGGATRGLADEKKIELGDGKLVEFVFDDNTTWLCNADTLEEVFPEAANPARSADGSFQLPSTLRSTGAERGVVSDIVLKVVNIFGKKAVAKGVGEIAGNIEKKQLENLSGLYRLDNNFNLVTYDPVLSDKPFLLFIHGTASSTKGSFEELVHTKVWNDLQALYGNNILAFQHETLTKSPLQNAVELIEQLPQMATLHIVSHSRGGLIGDILSRFCNSNESKRGFDAEEMAYLEKTERSNDLKYIEQLKKELQHKKITIGKFIRVACPANGTILASKRLDNFFNISLNLIGLGTGLSANPVYGAFKSLIAAVIDTKNSQDELPGIEAMNPESPFIKVLNSPATTIEIDNPLMVISGNCKASFSFKALMVIASKLFYFTDNDLVVHTLSMYQGSKRRQHLKYLFDEAGDVDHFHYFKNEKTSTALLAALKADGDLSVAGFKTEQQKILAQAERNALIKAEGGAVFTNTVTGLKPIVVLLPGIMGSNLFIDGKSIWINYWNFLKGGLRHLDISNTNVTASSLVGTSYGKLVRHLSADYDVVTFPYDWRLPITESATLFNQKILELLKYRQPVKIIGHSMGGVLVRDFILKHQDTWQLLNESAGFRLIFLGAPLGGSFRIPAVLFGQDSIIHKLSMIDIVHTKKQLLEIFSKFPGLLSLLPLSVDGPNDFAKGATWNKLGKAFSADGWPLPVEEGKDLDWFRDYRSHILQALDSIDYSNIVYIAGKDKATPCGYRIDETGRGKELVFLSTAEGDQSVTWDSGIPRKLTEQNAVYYVNVTHGALANEPVIFDGISQILAQGSTNLLRKTRPVVRGEEKIFKSPDHRDFDLSEEGVEKTLLGLESHEKGTESITETTVQLSVSNGHLKYAAFPVIAGHFLDDGILNAEAEIDKMLQGALSERHRLGLYPGLIGSSEVILSVEQDVKGGISDGGLRGGIIVGLGRFGELTSFLLTKTIEQGIAKYLLEVNRMLSQKNSAGKGMPLGISTLLIGSGYGGLSVENSARAIIQGVQNANAKIEKLHNGKLKSIEYIEFIELYEDRSLSCLYSLSKIEKDQALKIRIGKKEIRKQYGSRKRIAAESSEGWWNRISVKMDEKPGSAEGMRRLRFSVSTGGAREEIRNLFINPAGIESMIRDSSVGNRWSPRLAKTLFEILIPVDFKEQLKRQGNINWILDKHTASYPWELLQDNSTEAKPLSVTAGMIRQLGTPDYRLKINAVAGNNALIVGEPELHGFLTPLPGAYEEGRLVARIIERNGFQATPLLRSTAQDILQELHAGYKIIHLAGHGIFNHESPEESGMVIGKNNYLTSADIGNMSTVPELVFVNCCHLGRTDGAAEEYYRNVYKMAANIGTQLIENGVKAVIVAGWAVNDEDAFRFSERFYQGMFDGDCFGDAVRKAREAIYHEFAQSNTWGAYQCYGDPFYKFRNTRTSTKKIEKEFIIAEEAEIELNNLQNEIKAGKSAQQSVLDQLAAIAKAVDAAGIRKASITEKEALLYADLYEYDLAIAKFQSLLSIEKADFSVSSLEKYCNIRMKKYVADYIKSTKKKKGVDKSERENWLKNAEEVIQGLESLLMISPTAERYNLLGSAYKRKGILCTGENEKLKAYTEAAYYYSKAHELQGVHNKAYAITNWYALESVLVIAGDRKWGEKIVKDNQELYRLPSKKEAVKKLQDIYESYKPNKRNMEYWILVEVPNCHLCSLVVNPTVKDQKDWDDVLHRYREVWNQAGSKGDKFAEIEHLQLLSDALSLGKEEGAGLKEKIEELKSELEKLI